MLHRAKLRPPRAAGFAGLVAGGVEAALLAVDAGAGLVMGALPGKSRTFALTGSLPGLAWGNDGPVSMPSTALPTVRGRP
jgi:hypothetical protein